MSLSSLISNVLQLTSTWSPYYHYLSSRALRYTNRKCQSYGTTDTGCIFFSMISKQQYFSGILVTLRISNPSGKYVERSAVLKNIARKTHSRDFGWIGTQIIFQNMNQLKRSAQISCFSFISYQIFTHEFISKRYIYTHVQKCEHTHAECDTGV